jgi:U2 small nuclear ribonucleoprotein B''
METVQGATAALQAEAGVAFFGKDLKIGYAHHTSDRIAKRDGTYVPKAKRKNMTNDDDDAAVAPADDEAAPATTTTSPPSHIVLAQELPADATLEIIQQLFHTYPGYKEVRLPRPGLAFCEFESEPHATMALNGLQGFQLSPTHALQLDYGKA